MIKATKTRSIHILYRIAHAQLHIRVYKFLCTFKKIQYYDNQLCYIYDSKPV